LKDFKLAGKIFCTYGEDYEKFDMSFYNNCIKIIMAATKERSEYDYHTETFRINLD
jgi:hypothetical protein